MTGHQPIRASWANTDQLLTDYYDTEWGMPVFEESGVFERLSLEAFQSGLSWLTILKKRDAFREAFADFRVERVASFDQAQVEVLLSNVKIIRNRAKIEATLANARAVLALHEQGNTLADTVWSFMPDRSPCPQTEADVPSTSKESVALAKHLKAIGFRFVGPTTAFALMSAIGISDVHLESSHRRGCSGLWALSGELTDRGREVRAQVRMRSQLAL